MFYQVYRFHLFQNKGKTSLKQLSIHFINIISILYQYYLNCRRNHELTLLLTQTRLCTCIYTAIFDKYKESSYKEISSSRLVSNIITAHPKAANYPLTRVIL